MLKGKWRIAGQLRRPLNQHRFFVAYDEVTADNQLNRTRAGRAAEARCSSQNAKALKAQASERDEFSGTYRFIFRAECD